MAPRIWSPENHESANWNYFLAALLSRYIQMVAVSRQLLQCSSFSLKNSALYFDELCSGKEPRIKVVKRSPVSTGQLKRLTRRTSPAYQPGRLPGGSRAVALRNLILGLASCLYAFSTYPYRTWLPCAASSETTGTPEVRPSKSSRTKEKIPQVSYAHSR